MTILRDIPYENSQFRAELNGEPLPVEQVLFPELNIEILEYREGSDPEAASRRQPGRPSFTTLVLRRGFNGSLTLYQWYEEAAEGSPDARKDLRIDLLNEESETVARWAFQNIFPARYMISPLDAQDGSVLVETIELAFDSVEFE